MPATPAWPPRSAPRLFVTQALAEGKNIELDGQQAHYLARVMRVSPGDTVILCDNRTGEWAATVTTAGKRDVRLSVATRLRAREEVPDFMLCSALLKKPAFDFVLEKATELGVRTIQPVVTRRCVADSLNLERARTIMTEAAEQCARTALPLLTAPVSLENLVKEWPEDRQLYFADEQGGGAIKEIFAQPHACTALLIGPEGGFDDGEREAIRALGSARAISLGPRILRGETAAIAAIAAWMALAGDWSN